MQTLMRVHQFATLPQAAHVSEACHGYSTIAPNVHMSLLNCCSCRSHFSSYRPTTAHRSRSASMAGAEVPAPAGLPARALLIQARWLEPIFAGDKTWEVRGKNLHLRGRACLAHGGHLVGEVEFIDTHPIGTRDAGNALVAVPGHEHHFIGLQQNQAKTCVEDLTIFNYSRLFAWVMKNPRRYTQPIPYRHPVGAIQFVNLTRPGVLAKPSLGSRSGGEQHPEPPSTTTSELAASEDAENSSAARARSSSAKKRRRT